MQERELRQNCFTQKLGIPAISTGNMLREAMRNDTETGREVTYYMDNGLLVPDDVILAIVRGPGVLPGLRPRIHSGRVPRLWRRPKAWTVWESGLTMWCPLKLTMR